MGCVNVQYYKTKIGELILGSFEGRLCLLDFRYRKMRKAVDDRIKKGLNANFAEQDDEILKRTREQLDEYLNGKRKEFDIPILMVGTDFQKRVWQALMNVKYGETASYSELAKEIKNEKAVRAVASANGANSIGLMVPCHRIIGANGELVGYAGGLAVKKKLLRLETAWAKSPPYETLRLCAFAPLRENFLWFPTWLSIHKIIPALALRAFWW